MTTEITTDYYVELKRKYDDLDELIKLTKQPQEARITMTDKAADIMLPHINRLKPNEV